jgi:hypothetical protein
MILLINIGPVKQNQFLLVSNYSIGAAFNPENSMNG